MQILGCRAPHGARGLKLINGEDEESDAESRPARGAWIEIHSHVLKSNYQTVAPRTGRVD